MAAGTYFLIIPSISLRKSNEREIKKSGYFLCVVSKGVMLMEVLLQDKRGMEEEDKISPKTQIFNFILYV